ncbi:MAG: DoxX family membrane protein [Caulobacteraceae bacterium]
MNAIGRRVYGLGAAGLGIVVLAWGVVPQDWLPVPAHNSAWRPLAYAAAAVLIAAGLAINFARVASIAALALAALFASGMLVLELPPALAKPADWVGWQAIAESTAMALGGVIACARSSSVARIARWVFGACLLVFGASHFVYAKLTASLVPAWLPPSQLAWATITGVAQIAAGLAMLSGIRARLAAILLAVMYAIFGALVHIPSILADPSSQSNWAENAINLILLGVAWSVADSLETPIP